MSRDCVTARVAQVQDGETCAHDLRWLISAWPIRMDHESTRGIMPDGFDSYMFTEALTNIYEAGSMLSELWLHMHDVYQNATEHDDVLSSDLLLDLS